MKKLISIAALLGTTMMAPAALAQDIETSVSVSVDYVTDYIFRGAQLGETSVQSGIEVGIGDFAIGGWASTGIGENSVLSGDEFDLYASYSFAASETVGIDVGATYYHYPQGGGFFSTNDGGSGTYEVFAGASFDTMLAPSITAYYDLTLEAITIEGGIGHSFETGPTSTLDLGLTAGLVDGDGFSYEYGQASIALGHSFTDDVSAYVGANYALASEDNFYNIDIDLDDLDASDVEFSDNTFWIGVGFAAGF